MNNFLSQINPHSKAKSKYVAEKMNKIWVLLSKKNWKLPQIHEPNVLNESIPWNCKMNQVGTSYWK